MNTGSKSITILAALESYLHKVQEHSDNDFKENYTILWESGQAPKYTSIRTAKWYKIFRIDSQKSIFCFIDPSTGDIYKPASWAAPAKGIRGNIFNDKLPLTSGSLYK